MPGAGAANSSHINEYSNARFKRESSLLDVGASSTDNSKVLSLIKRCGALIATHSKSIATEDSLEDIVDKTAKIQKLAQEMQEFLKLVKESPKKMATTTERGNTARTASGGNGFRAFGKTDLNNRWGSVWD